VRVRKQLLLQPADVPPLQNNWEVVGVFNPGVTEFRGEVVLMARVAERPSSRHAGFVALPRWKSTGGVAVDWIAEANVDSVDARVVRVAPAGRVRLTFASHLRLVNCGTGRTVKSIESINFLPVNRCEEYGVEDARITRIDDRYYVTYVAVSRHGAATALASTVDFRSFTRHGIIFPPENKDVVLFPERFGDRYCALHRPTAATPFTAPEMWIAWSHDLEHWGRHEPILLAGGHPWASGRVGAGTPPIRVDEGWLVIYHANRRPAGPGQVGQYVAAAMLLDADQPGRIIGQSAKPLFVPTEVFERDGFVPDVVFPTGTVVRGDTVLVYYGASDTSIGLVELSLSNILSSLAQPRQFERMPEQRGTEFA
jgi:predicted GH43/DUF377 family glycosyl hydrolase